MRVIRKTLFYTGIIYTVSHGAYEITCIYVHIYTCCKSVAWKADGCGFESHLRQPIFYLKNDFDELCCVALPFCCVVVVALPFSASPGVLVRAL